MSLPQKAIIKCLDYHIVFHKRLSIRFFHRSAAVLLIPGVRLIKVMENIFRNYLYVVHMQFSFTTVNIWKFGLFEQLLKKLLIVLYKRV